MKTIWKFPFEIADRVKITVPAGAKVRHVGLDPNDDPCLWCQVYSDAPKEDLELFVVETGQTIPKEAIEFLGSFMCGPFVWHVFTK